MNIAEVLQSLSPDALLELFELDTTVIGGSDHFYFHAGTNQLTSPVVWQGVTYQPFPIEAEGFDMSPRGALPRPRLRVANVAGVISAVVQQLDDLIGAKVIRRRTFARYIDAVNFPGGTNASADPTQYLDDDVFYVERKISENKVVVEFELSSAMDLQGVMLPNRPITTNYCWWQYRQAGCGYTGTSYFDVSDSPVTTPAQDVCSKTVAGCKKRFGTGTLPFGGFPGAKSYKV